MTATAAVVPSRLLRVAGVVSLSLVAAAGGAPAAPVSGRLASSASTVGATAATTAASLGAQQAFSRMTPDQRIGQLFMVGTPATGASSAALTAVRSYHVGSVILTGRSSAGVTATRSVTDTLQAAATVTATAGVPLVVATDQEGGYVQVLSGPGFSTMPTALTQGTWSSTTLRSAATTWGRQLAAAGVNLDLAPVMDVVPSAAAAQTNPPIGVYQREFGYGPTAPARAGVDFAVGMTTAGVHTTMKHYPGLGRVTANTDTSSGVTDTVTTRTDPNLLPFQRGTAAGIPFLMVSSAIYSRIAPGTPAVFSTTVMETMARGDLGFRGVLVSDDLGNAAQVQYLSPASRATSFLRAGGDMVLTVDATQVPAMVAAVKAAAAQSAGFASALDAKALRVLTVKQHLGLLHPTGAFRATDVDEDGAADVMGVDASGTLRLYRGDDQGGWRGIGTGWGAGWDGLAPVLTAGDLNGDGHVDVVGRAGDGTLWLYAGNGRGGVASRSSLGRGWLIANRVLAAGDVSGDGHPDLLATTVSGTLYLYTGNGLGGLTSRRAVGGGWQGVDLLAAVGDVNGDGHPDLVGRWRGTGQAYFYLGDGRGGFTRVSAGAGWQGFTDFVAPGDFDGDGWPDLLAETPSGQLWLYRSTGRGRWFTGHAVVGSGFSVLRDLS